jgi:hypothetical protein
MDEAIFINGDSVIVSREWYEKAVAYAEGRLGCPWCGGSIVFHKTDGCHPRPACMACNRYLKGVELEDARRR